jgi:hypothetical protein
MELPDKRCSRRAFGKAVVSIGGSAALAACAEREEATGTTTAVPSGRTDWTLPNRQHAWDEFLSTNEYGKHELPRHHVFLYLNYTGDVPTDADRAAVADAFATLERAYEWSPEGLLFTVSYSRAYFDRFPDAALPASIDLPRPAPLGPNESPTIDRQDAVLHLASDVPTVVVAAEEALFGDLDTVNGVAADADLSDVFERGDRRTGFIGSGLPAEKQTAVDSLPDEGPVPEAAPEFMGFRTPFPKNQASEDYVTIANGPFAGSTTQHIERIEIDLDGWYDLSHGDRVGLMFSPEHATEDLVGPVGERLGDSNGVTERIADGLVDDAETHGYVGHAQKTARARQDGTPVILRRDVDTVADGSAGLHFQSLQSRMHDFTYTRKKMSGANIDRPSGEAIDLTAFDGIGPGENHGILEYLTTTHRGNFLMPRRDLRALPRPRPN